MQQEPGKTENKYFRSLQIMTKFLSQEEKNPSNSHFALRETSSNSVRSANYSLYYYTIVFKHSKTRFCCESSTKPFLCSCWKSSLKHTAVVTTLYCKPFSPNCQREWGKVERTKAWVNENRITISLQCFQISLVKSVRHSQFCFLHLLKKKVLQKKYELKLSVYSEYIHFQKHLKATSLESRSSFKQEA